MLIDLDFMEHRKRIACNKCIFTPNKNMNQTENVFRKPSGQLIHFYHKFTPQIYTIPQKSRKLQKCPGKDLIPAYESSHYPKNLRPHLLLLRNLHVCSKAFTGWISSLKKPSFKTVFILFVKDLWGCSLWCIYCPKLHNKRSFTGFKKGH